MIGSAGQLWEFVSTKTANAPGVGTHCRYPCSQVPVYVLRCAGHFWDHAVTANHTLSDYMHATDIPALDTHA